MRKCDDPLCVYFYKAKLGNRRRATEPACFFPDWNPKPIKEVKDCENHKIDLLWSYQHYHRFYMANKHGVGESILGV